VLRLIGVENLRVSYHLEIAIIRPLVTAVCSLLAINWICRTSTAAFYETLAWSENMSYDQSLKFLDVPSLRRPRADLYWCYKILFVFGLVEITSDVFVTKYSCTSTRGHQYKLYKHYTSACVRSNFFAELIVNARNNLPKSVDFSTLSRFKRTIKRVHFSDLRFELGF